MKRSAFILVILISSIALSFPKGGDTNKEAGRAEVVKQILPIVKSILQGEDFSVYKENIAPGAYLIDGSSYESMDEVLKNSSERRSFVEGKGFVIQYVHLWMPDNKKSAYMILETKYSNGTKTCWHSILFELNKNQKWEILSWHKS